MMDPVTFSRRIAKLEYEAVRWPFTFLDDRFVTRYGQENTLLRSGFQLFLGSLDRFAGWLLGDETISQRGQDLLRLAENIPPSGEQEDSQPVRDAADAPAGTGEAAAAEEPAADEPVAPEPVAPEPVAPESAAPEPAAPEPAAPEMAAHEVAEHKVAAQQPGAEELAAAELAAGQPATDEAGGQLDTPAEPAAPGTVDVTFTLPGEVDAGHVALCGDFNNWTAGNIALKRGGDGSWQTTVPLKPGHSYHYRYLLDGERWENAWQADRYEPNPFGSTNSVVIVGSPELAMHGMS